MVPDLAEHARFFDHLVELVPAKFYYGDDYERVMPRHLAKAARAAFKADVKFKAKIAKREKLDPTTAATTLEVQRRKAQANPDDGDGKGPSPSGRKNADAVAVQPSEDQPAAAKGLNLQLSGAALSRQQLLDRLHKKVEEARQRRKAPENTAAKAREWRQNTLRGNVAAKQQQQQQQQQQMLAGAKRKNSAAEEPATGSDTPGGGKHAKLQGQGPQLAKKVRREDHGGASSGEEQLDFKFARIEVEDGGRYGKHAGARKPSKHVLLKQVEAKKAEMEALEGTEEGKAKTQQEAWKTAMARAAGEKVLDDPKLLRRSLKRESKRRAQHSKAWQSRLPTITITDPKLLRRSLKRESKRRAQHSKAWQERVATQQDSQAARQAKRNENLAARRQTKMDNKKAKREKKLLRPGFEGRKEGFITTGGSGRGGGGGGGGSGGGGAK